MSTLDANQIIIRALDFTDLTHLFSLEQLTQTKPWTLEAFLSCYKANYPGWVLQIDGAVVGFVLVSFSSAECHILNLCIHPDFQGKKLGRKLLSHALIWAKLQGGEMVYLEVRRSNRKAIWLYRKMHFKEIGERKNYYPLEVGHEDALVFARDIGIEDIEDLA